MRPTKHQLNFLILFNFSDAAMRWEFYFPCTFAMREHYAPFETQLKIE